MINITEIQYLSSAIGQGKKWMAGEKKKPNKRHNGKRGKAKIKWEVVVKKTTLYYFNCCPGHERI